MSLTNYVPSRNRVYVRKFDHDEATKRYQSGEAIAELAAEYDVTAAAVRWVVTPGGKERNLENVRKWRTTTCEMCGGPAMRLVGGKKEHNPDGRVLCNRCRSDERRERLLFDSAGALIAVRCSALDCANGERWQAPENFQRGERHREVREGGIHSRCRACGTRDRQRYRERRKVPCVDCGAPALPPNEKTTSGSKIARCRDCYYKNPQARGPGGRFIAA